MTEPPAKRARRVDSSDMWERKDTHHIHAGQDIGHHRQRSPNPQHSRRDDPREERRYRSRSRDRNERRRDRSWSRDRRVNDRKERGRDDRGARDRMRSVSKERGHDRRGKGDKARERSRSPRRNGARPGTRSPPPRGPKGDRRPNPKEARSRNDGRITNGPTDAVHRPDEMDVDLKEDVDEDEMEAMMRKSMGFTKFRTTKNTKVPGNNIYGVRKEKQNEYRQYMNRPGGFNRPLSPSR
ncbi:Uncharacterized protein PECH_002942 [Penicillium ucsense]|uniref:U4/U6.U5 small nuclear ribonucleoprotein 27kDa protein domain-containing protein n=1 Tax=Penicillium ucsense TaxID=2839758 RepID=A0A8J8W6L5_9EURO|nr:Uncharacterized protein PECM_003945 [Penicillium ucsense]KAF7737766.1 Uncharacterized protein PECH_002942 [Penicillium ucsense]